VADAAVMPAFEATFYCAFWSAMPRCDVDEPWLISRALTPLLLISVNRLNRLVAAGIAIADAPLSAYRDASDRQFFDAPIDADGLIKIETG
jgi:hypothetical protein